MGKFIVVVLDGFGIGAMGDVAQVRPADTGANTCLHIFEKIPNLSLPNLAALGLANALGCEFNGLPRNDNATFGKANLAHYWADTFFGHQEIMGTKPKMPRGEAINGGRIEEIFHELSVAGFDVRYYEPMEGRRLLVVENACTVADNIECDPGQAFNVTAALDVLPFETALSIGRVVRSIARTPRVITFGGHGIGLNDLIAAVEVHGDYVGVNAPRSGVYKDGYQCVHMGYGVDQSVQIPYLLGREGVPVYLLGKVADVCANEFGTSESIVETEEVLGRTIDLAGLPGGCFICANIQETDLAGHAEDAERYAEKLRVADAQIGVLVSRLGDNDVLVVMADHGNDPTIGHPHHTRELVPLLVASKHIKPGSLGIRETLSDVGATVTEYFHVQLPENGRSFLPQLF